MHAFDIVRGFLETGEVAEIVGDEGQAALIALLASADPRPVLHPHVVALPGAKVKVDKDGGRRHVGVLDCPDCGRGLVSRGADLICPQLDVATTLAGDLDKGRIVACGEGLTDG
jgi:hypothetical protein